MRVLAIANPFFLRAPAMASCTRPAAVTCINIATAHSAACAIPAVAFAAAQAHGGDVRCGITVLDFSLNSVEVTIERPRALISHDLAAIKGHGRHQFLRDVPPSSPPQVSWRGLAAAPRRLG